MSGLMRMDSVDSGVWLGSETLSELFGWGAEVLIGFLVVVGLGAVVRRGVWAAVVEVDWVGAAPASVSAPERSSSVSSGRGSSSRGASGWSLVEGDRKS